MLQALEIPGVPSPGTPIATRLHEMLKRTSSRSLTAEKSEADSINQTVTGWGEDSKESYRKAYLEN
jgi:hypothetical protein